MITSCLVCGAMITETLFQIEGIGYTAYQAMTTGISLFYVLHCIYGHFTLLGNLIADILYAVVDPRVRVN